MALEFPVIDPVALALGPFQIRWYALAYLAGFLIGWRYCLRLAGFDGGLRPNREDIDDFLTWVVIGVVLGGRFGSVLFYNLNYHVQNPFVDLTLPFVNWVISFPSVLAIWQGGMSFHGGALGVIAALFIYPRLKKFPPLPLCDIVCAAVPIGLFFGRIANFINAELYGRVTDAPWGIVFPNGGEQPRHPSQLYEAFFEGAVLFVILFFLIRNEHVRKRPGIVAGAFLAGYGLFRGCIEFYREPDAHIGLYFDLFSQGQLLSFPMVLVGFGVIVFACYSHKQRML